MRATRKQRRSTVRRALKMSGRNIRLAANHRSKTQKTPPADLPTPLPKEFLNAGGVFETKTLSPNNVKKVLEEFFGGPVSIETAIRNPKTNGITVVTVPTDAEAKAEFVSAAENKDKHDGRNDYVARFLSLTDLILRGPGATGSFSFQDFLIANRMFEIPREELERLFALFEAAMVRLNKWSKIDGCYDFPVYVIVA